MPRRPLARAVTSASATSHAPSPALPTSNFLTSDVLELRRQWKWAAFSQFFFTFAPLFNMSDVSIADIEDDLTRSTGAVLPRIMQRLLYTLSLDRKVNLDNWQTALRKQYLKRDPEASPLGPEPSRTPAPESSPAPETGDEAKVEKTHDIGGDPLEASTMHTSSADEFMKEESAENNTEVVAIEAGTPQPMDDALNPSIKHQLSSDASAAVSIKEDSSPREESKDWLDLPMLDKLNSMHLLTEWQFQNPQRLRTIMKDDDEAALWRIEPIGYDAKSNAYWLIGADRLWVQRTSPKPSHSKKRKRPATVDSGSQKAKRSANGPIGKKSKEAVALKSGQMSGRPVRRDASQTASAVLAGRGGGRAAKTQAKMKLDAQAKDLAEFQRQAAASARNKGRSPTRPPPPPRGTRLSKRLRGAIEEDEWQPVPDEWLEKSNGIQALPKTGLESDAESDLTSLSEGNEEHTGALEIVGEEINGNKAKGDQFDEKILDDRGIEVHPELPGGFVEWETIAVTLDEWECVPELFANAVHYTEKALYKVLTVDIVPVITAELKEIVRQRQIEEALVHRKRSSRIAIKESEKEEAELAAKKKAEESEKMSRARRLEARQLKEEAEREKRETAREQRRREREQREAQPRQGSKRRADASDDMLVDVVGNAPLSKKPHTNGSHAYQSRQANGSTSGSGSGARTPSGEDWELDCEICYRRGINQDDGQPMMSCGVCNKWQHISCHDSADLRAGRPKRNWDTEEFVCQRCRSRAMQKYDAAYHQQYQPRYQEPLAGHSQQSQSTDRMTFIQPTVNSSAPRAHSTYPTTQSYASSIPQNGHDNFRTTTPTSMAQQRPYQPHSAITFAHYQPDPQGFSTKQTYQRDHPTPSQAYQRPPQFAASRAPPPPPQPDMAANLRPVQPSSIHSPQLQYGNGEWTPQNYTTYGGGTSFPDQQNAHPPDWQPPRQITTDPRVSSNHYPQYQSNSVMGSTPYQLPR